jgi:putative flippase GtrA
MVTRFARFIIAGGVNTGLTYALYLALLHVLPYLLAYVVTYAAGIVIGYLLNALWVFRRSPTMRTAATYPLVYLANLALGMALLACLVEILGVPREWAPLIVLAVTVPLMFVLTRGLFQRGPAA